MPIPDDLLHAAMVGLGGVITVKDIMLALNKLLDALYTTTGERRNVATAEDFFYQNSSSLGSLYLACECGD